MASNGQSDNAHDFKVVLLGEGCVGKTSLLIRYVENMFNSKHVTTVQAAYLVKKINIGGRRIKLSIWDTAGQEKFHALGPIYYRGSNGAVLVYDITNNKSFQKVKSWVKELRKILGADICLVIAGNKTDLEKDRNVTVEEAETYANQVGATHWHTSAKQNKGIEEMFLMLSQKMMEHAMAQEQQSSANMNRQNSTRRNVLLVDDEQTETPTSKHCCGSS